MNKKRKGEYRNTYQSVESWSKVCADPIHASAGTSASPIASNDWELASRQDAITRPAV